MYFRVPAKMLMDCCVGRSEPTYENIDELVGGNLRLRESLHAPRVGQTYILSYHHVTVMELI